MEDQLPDSIPTDKLLSERNAPALDWSRESAVGVFVALQQPTTERLIAQWSSDLLILPGDVKRMLAQEVEAQRAGRAALVAAREETAATRARANTAQILEGHPMLLRLREIEALAQVAGGVGNTVVLTLPAELMGALGGKKGE